MAKQNFSSIKSDSAMRANKMPGMFVKTFGCQMNEYDSEKIVTLLSANYKPVQSIEQAQLIFVNTCSVREKGEHKFRSLVGKIRLLREKTPQLIIGVGGCVAQQEGEAIVKAHPIVDFVVGTHNLSLIPSLVAAVKNGHRHQVAVDYREGWEDLPHGFAPLEATFSLGSPYSFAHRVRALVAIQRGCNKSCSFCVVPNTRGPNVSRPPDEIIREITLKVNLGAREVLLLGQNVNAYGRDLQPRLSFEHLIERLTQIKNLKRIRFTSPHPQDVRNDFIALYRMIPQLCPHIHLPLQSGSDRILKLMNRNYLTKRYLEIVEALRAELPRIAITTDIIVGFPTETSDDFAATLDMIRRVQFDGSYSFAYSLRPHTSAAKNFTKTDETPKEIASARLFELQQLQEEISFKKNLSVVGSTVEVLVEGSRKNISSSLRGRVPENTLVEVASQSKSEKVRPTPGELIQVLVNHASPHCLRAQVL